MTKRKLPVLGGGNGADFAIAAVLSARQVTGFFSIIANSKFGLVSNFQFFSFRAKRKAYP
jgi:hypothetical protein